MTIEQWVTDNVLPNVLAVEGITQYQSEGDITTYDVSVVALVAEGIVNKITQPVYGINGSFYFGRTEVKNWEQPAVEVSPEQKLIEYLDNLVGVDGYVINTPISTTKGKAAVVTIGNEKKVIAIFNNEIVVRKFSEV